MAGAKPARVPTPSGLQGPPTTGGWAKTQGVGALEGLSELGQGAYGLGKSFFNLVADKDPQSEQEAAKNIYDATIGGQIGEFKKAGQTKGLEKLGHYMAGSTPLVGPMAAGAGEAIGQGDYGRGAVLGAAAIEGGRSMAHVLTPEVADAARQVKDYAAINDGQVRTVNQGVRAPLNQLEGRIHEEIGRHANAVIDADEAQQRAQGTPGVGSVDATKAAAEARDMSEKIGGEFATRVNHLIMRAAQGTLTMREAKALTTEVGREAASFDRTGKLREAAVLDTLYNGLHKATAARAAELGSDYAKSWQHYIDETRSWKSMKSGLAGDLQNSPHAEALRKLANPSNASEVNEIVQKMKQYKVDPSAFQKAREVGPSLEKMSKESHDNFHSIIRGITKRPVTVGGTYAAMHMVPGAGWIFPLIVAGKLAGMLDKADMAKILNDIGTKFPGEAAGRVTEPGKGPMATPPLRLPAPGETSSGLFESAAGEEPEIERLRRAPPREATPMTPEEVEGLRKALDEKEARDLAKRLTRAKKAKGGRP